MGRRTDFKSVLPGLRLFTQVKKLRYDNPKLEAIFMPDIILKNVICRYPHTRAEALSGVSLRIGQGEYVAVVGLNGSGKSTLARLFNGLMLPSAGSVSVGGLSTAEKMDREEIRAMVGMVFQNPDSQIVAASVEDDIAFGPENLGMAPAEINRRVEEALRRFGLESLRQREPHRLSGGQKQRTVLAGVMATAPRVLVLDEPASMLDPRSRRLFNGHLRELWQEGTTIVHITHDMEEAATAPRLLVLAAGRLAHDGGSHEFFTSPGLLERTGLEAPLAVRLQSALAGRGLQLPATLSLDELAKSACACS